MANVVRKSGAKVIWRCHVGMDNPNQRAREAWDFLRPYVRDIDAYVFSRSNFAWDGLATNRITVIQPSIDAFDPRNTAEFGSAVLDLVGNRRLAQRIGRAARRRVREHFLGPHHLQRDFELFEHLITPTSPRAHARPGRAGRKAS